MLLSTSPEGTQASVLPLVDVGLHPQRTLFLNSEWHNDANHEPMSAAPGETGTDPTRLT
jgi:hypothetical protein